MLSHTNPIVLRLVSNMHRKCNHRHELAPIDIIPVRSIKKIPDLRTHRRDKIDGAINKNNRLDLWGDHRRRRLAIHTQQ